MNKEDGGRESFFSLGRGSLVSFSIPDYSLDEGYLYLKVPDVFQVDI